MLSRVGGIIMINNGPWTCNRIISQIINSTQRLQMMYLNGIVGVPPYLRHM